MSNVKNIPEASGALGGKPLAVGTNPFGAYDSMKVIRTQGSTCRRSLTPAIVLIFLTLMFSGAGCVAVNLPPPLAMNTPAHLLGKKGYSITLDQQVSADLASYPELDGELSEDIFGGFRVNYGLSRHYELNLELGGNSQRDCYGNDCESSSLTVIGAGVRRQLHRTRHFAASAGLKLGFASDSTTDGESGDVFLLQIPLEVGVRAKSWKDHKSKYLGRPRTSIGGHAYAGIQPFFGIQNVNGDSRSVVGLNLPHVGLGCQLSWFYLNAETFLSFISSPVSDIRPGGSLSLGVMWD